MNNKPNFFGSVLKAIACTQNNNDDEDMYMKGVIQPAKQIRQMMKQIGEADPTTVQIRETLALLQTIFKTKGVDQAEQIARFEEIAKYNHLAPELIEPFIPGDLQSL